MIARNLAATLAICLSTAASAQNYPNKPIRMIVPFSAGGGSDLAGRVVAQGLSQNLGQPVIIDNRDGLAGSLGSALAAKAPADGCPIGQDEGTQISGRGLELRTIEGCARPACIDLTPRNPAT